jgi:flagellar biosynthesis/type III secretory pathway protein FliH
MICITPLPLTIEDGFDEGFELGIELGLSEGMELGVVEFTEISS